MARRSEPLPRPISRHRGYAGNRVPRQQSGAALGAWIALAMLVVAGLMLVLREDTGRMLGVGATDVAAAIGGIALLIFLASPVLGRPRGRVGSLLRDVGLWGALALLVFTLYQTRAEIGALVASLRGDPPSQADEATGSTAINTPPDAAPVGDRSIRVRVAENGQFFVKSQINGANVRMLVDTGASIVVLRHEDARLIGVAMSDLDYSIPIRTASGEAFAARVRLDSLAVGPVGLRDVEALVANPGALHISLLGMSFLSRLRSYQIEGAFLTLRG
ncbi:MAG: TIGR02281 family clan AA aspartic protease [Rhizobiales bacterium]|nr:TIGR02281 family clan AA aspartic protease [Hyphomicrobiales bacterium]